jgi:hypothetical protein
MTTGSRGSSCSGRAASRRCSDGPLPSLMVGAPSSGSYAVASLGWCSDMTGRCPTEGEPSRLVGHCMRVGNLAVVRAVALDLDRLGFASVTLEGLTLDTCPMYVKVRWSGQLVDLERPEGIAAAGAYPPAYPEGACLSFSCPSISVLT